jgi:hypothetical protein
MLNSKTEFLCPKNDIVTKKLQKMRNEKIQIHKNFLVLLGWPNQWD